MSEPTTLPPSSQDDALVAALSETPIEDQETAELPAVPLRENPWPPEPPPAPASVPDPVPPPPPAPEPVPAPMDHDLAWQQIQSIARSAGLVLPASWQAFVPPTAQTYRYEGPSDHIIIPNLLAVRNGDTFEAGPELALFLSALEQQGHQFTPVVQ